MGPLVPSPGVRWKLSVKPRGHEAAGPNARTSNRRSRKKERLTGLALCAAIRVVLEKPLPPFALRASRRSGLRSRIRFSSRAELCRRLAQDAAGNMGHGHFPRL